MAAKLLAIGGLVLVMCVQAMLAADFDYDTSKTTGKGPARWATLFPNDCGKTNRQSPVNIESSKAVYKDLGKINLSGYSTKATFDVSNNGHSFVVALKPDTFSMSGGGLVGTYKLHSFHLHWGAADSKGSEHTLEGKMYPAEIHLVHFNSKYPDLTTAAGNADGLAVLGVFFTVGGSDNAALQSFLKYSANVTNPKDKVTGLTMEYGMDALLPNDKSAFYRYDGSLTTPNCNEVVTWTVFKNTLQISDAQLKMFRDLKMANGTAMVDNYRPVQDLNGRKVLRSYEGSTTAPTVASSAVHVANAIAVVMAAIVALKMLL